MRCFSIVPGNKMFFVHIWAGSNIFKNTKQVFLTDQAPQEHPSCSMEESCFVFKNTKQVFLTDQTQNKFF
jgi:hypothetical protein